MDLTDDIDDFKQKVKAEGVIGNVDSPEAGLDALAQALLCDGQNHEDGKELNIWKNSFFLYIFIFIFEQTLQVWIWLNGEVRVSKKLLL